MMKIYNQEYFTELKKNKNKIILFSYINYFINQEYQTDTINFFRIDLDELSILNGMKDKNFITDDWLIPVISSYKKLFPSIPLIVDVPLNICLNQALLGESLLNFYNNTKSDILLINHESEVMSIVVRMNQLKIPYFVNIDYSQFGKDKNAVEKLLGIIKEYALNSCSAIILTGFDSGFVSSLKDEFKIPIINNLSSKYSDGYYGRFIEIFGIKSGYQNNLINLNQIIKDTISESLLNNQ